nr:DUF1294 domain-containing protein [Metabacillus malikii]
MLITIYLAVNLISFSLMGIDKNRARRGEWRIKESTIWLIAIIGGALGATLGMNHFRHKTKHAIFKYGLPLIFIGHLLLFVYLYKSLA